MSAPNPDVPPDWALRCPVCLRTDVFPEPELVEAVLAGWPTCCGTDMVLRLATEVD